MDDNLEKWPTIVKPFFDSKKHYQKILEEHIKIRVDTTNYAIRFPARIDSSTMIG
jgi:hypothetical protein